MEILRQGCWRPPEGGVFSTGHATRALAIWRSPARQRPLSNITSRLFIPCDRDVITCDTPLCGHDCVVYYCTTSSLGSPPRSHQRLYLSLIIGCSLQGLHHARDGETGRRLPGQTIPSFATPRLHRQGISVAFCSHYPPNSPPSELTRASSDPFQFQYPGPLPSPNL